MNDDYVPPAFRHRSEPPPSQPPPGHRPPPPPSMNPISRIEFERLFGGRVLAWIGGLATLLGVIFLMRSAVDSSWFTEEIRTLMAAFGSLLLLGIGLWLHEKKGHLEVARIAVAVAIPGLYATTFVASQVYDLISPVIGLEAAALVGVLGVYIAVRWSSMLVASVGMLGALAAPMLVGTETDGGSIAFVALALAASVGVLLWQRWNWLALGAFLVSAPQLIAWISDSGFISFEGGPNPANPSCSSLRFWPASGCSTPPRPSATSSAAGGGDASRCPPGCCSSAAACWWSAPAASSSAIRTLPWTPGSSASPPSTSCSAPPRSASASIAKSARC